MPEIVRVTPYGRDLAEHAARRKSADALDALEADLDLQWAEYNRHVARLRESIAAARALIAGPAGAPGEREI